MYGTVWCNVVTGAGVLALGIASPVAAQDADTAATKRTEQHEAPITFGISGWPGRHGPAVRMDAMMIDQFSLGIHAMSQQLGPATRVYGAEVAFGAELPAPGWRWLRVEMGMGAYAQTSARALRWYQRAGIGYVASVTAAAFRKSAVRPELHGWAVLSTNTQFVGASAGLRVSSSVFTR